MRQRNVKLVIFGSRDFDDYCTLVEWMYALTHTYALDIDEIVCGMARGADLLGARWARANGVPIKEFPADWDTYGKSAGYRRNAEMAKYATHALGFWDGESRGTKHMIELCHRENLKLWVVQF